MLNEKFTVEYCNSHEVAILVKSNEEIKKINEILNSDHGQNFNPAEFNPGLCINSTWNSWCNLLWYVENNYEVIKASDFIEKYYPEYKWRKNMWVKCTTSGCGSIDLPLEKDSLAKVVKYEKDCSILLSDSSGEKLCKGWDKLTKSIVPATNNEIKNHLIKEAEEKGFVPGISLNGIETFNTDDKCSSHWMGRIKKTAWEYCNGKLSNQYVVIYSEEKGWAKLPKKTIILKFGNIDVECDKENHVAKVDGSIFNVKFISNLINKYNFTYEHFYSDSNRCYEISFPNIKIGCEIGTMEQVREIYKAIE